MKKKYLVRANHGWDTTEATYSEIVTVFKGYGLVERFEVVGVMRTRGYDLVHILKDNEEFDFETQEIVVKQAHKE